MTLYIPIYDMTVELGFIDIDRYNPGDVNLPIDAQMRDVAIRLRRNGHNDTKIGHRRINELLKTVFKDYPNDFRDERTVARWIREIEYRQPEQPVEESDIPNNVKSYAARLSLVKEAIFEGEQLTRREVEIATRMIDEFNDPLGKRVDLLPQLAVIFEIAERSALNAVTADIEMMLTLAPWEDDGELYAAALKTERIRPVSLRLLMPRMASHAQLAPDIIMGAVAHLQLPFLFHYFQPQKKRVVHVTRESFTGEQRHIKHPDEYMNDCNWRNIVKNYFADSTAETNKEDKHA